jgi:hypothetical protein
VLVISVVHNSSDGFLGHDSNKIRWFSQKAGISKLDVLVNEIRLKENVQ